MNWFTAILDSEAFGSSLIIRAKPLPSAYREWYCEARHQSSGEVIELVILAGWSLAEALDAIDAHSIGQSLKATGWDFGTPWIPQDEDQWGGYSAPLQPRAKPLTFRGVAID
jgi:hypothetical protein